MSRPEDTVRDTLGSLGARPSVFPGRQNRLAMFATTRLMPRGWAVRVMGGEMRRRYGGVR